MRNIPPAVAGPARLASSARLGRALLAGSALGFSILVHAQQPEPLRAFGIPAQPLHSAVLLFAEQSGLEIVLDNPELGRRYSHALSGRFSVEEGLQQLLQGSGLGYRLVEHQGRTRIQLLTLDVPGEAMQLAPLSVLSRGDDDHYRQPAAVFSVDREHLDRIPQASAGDLFNGIPGVQMANARSGAGFDPNIRGAQGHGRVKVLLDGSESTQSSRVTYAGNRSANYVEPDFIAGIDVEKGPGLESGALGGTISMRTFDVADIITDPQKGWGLRLRGMLGDNSGNGSRTRYCQTTNINTGAVNKPIDIAETTRPRCLEEQFRNNRTQYSMQTYDTGEYIPDGNHSGSLVGAWAPREDVEMLAGYARRLSGNYSAGKQGSVDRSYMEGQVRYYNDASLRESPSYWLPGDEVYGTFADTESWMAKARLSLGVHGLQFKYNHFDSRHVLHANVDPQTGPSYLDLFPLASSVEQQRYGIDYRYQPGHDWIDLQADAWLAKTQERLFLGETTASLVPQRIKTDTLGVGLRNTSQVAVFSRTLALKVGGNYKWETLDSNTEVNGIDLEQYGLFLSATLPIEHWLTLEGGVRHDDYRMTVDSAQYYRAANDNQGDNTSTHAGLSVQPFEPLQLFVRYAEGWRAPSSRENTLDNCAGGRTATGNCIQGLVKPEQSETIEWGANLMLDDVLLAGDRVGLKLSRFDNRYNDYIYGSGSSVLPIENIDKARFTGYEASLDYDAGGTFAEYAYTSYDRIEFCGISVTDPSRCDTADGSGDLTSRYAPARHQHSATLGLRLLERRLTLGSRANVVRGTGWDYKSMNRYEVYDLFASYEYKAATFGLSAQNIGDRYYFEAGTGAAWQLPAPGRTLRATLTFKL